MPNVKAQSSNFGIKVKAEVEVEVFALRAG
jgi:hypothetical protein